MAASGSIYPFNFASGEPKPQNNLRRKIVVISSAVAAMGAGQEAAAVSNAYGVEFAFDQMPFIEHGAKPIGYRTSAAGDGLSDISNYRQLDKQLSEIAMGYQEALRQTAQISSKVDALAQTVLAQQARYILAVDADTDAGSLELLKFTDEALADKGQLKILAGHLSDAADTEEISPLAIFWAKKTLSSEYNPLRIASARVLLFSGDEQAAALVLAAREKEQNAFVASMIDNAIEAVNQ
jgi:hypothetical protein